MPYITLLDSVTSAHAIHNPALGLTCSGASMPFTASYAMKEAPAEGMILALAGSHPLYSPSTPCARQAHTLILVVVVAIVPH